MNNEKIKIYFVCSGLGVVNRGYESFTRECYDSLKADNRLDAYLFKGGGQSQLHERKLFNLPRVHGFTKAVAAVFRMDSYTIEQFTFALSIVPYLVIGRPHVILVSDFILSTYLWHLRKFLKLKYQILFSNGAPNGPPFHRCDHVQQLLPLHFDMAVSGGTAPDMQSIIPYGIKIDKSPFITEAEKTSRRIENRIPKDAFVVLCVAAINKSHKRIDYLIEEFSKLTQPNLFLVVLGQMDSESEEIMNRAKEKLPLGNYIIKSVPQEEVNHFYKIADVFVLASLNEGLPRVLIEALSHGLPILVHEYALTRQVLSDNGYFADFTKENALKNLMEYVHNQEVSSLEHKTKRKEFALETYGWDSLNEKYVEMIIKTHRTTR